MICKKTPLRDNLVEEKNDDYQGDQTKGDVGIQPKPQAQTAEEKVAQFQYTTICSRRIARSSGWAADLAIRCERLRSTEFTGIETSKEEVEGQQLEKRVEDSLKGDSTVIDVPPRHSQEEGSQ